MTQAPIHNCIDCGIKIWKKGKRCMSCFAKERKGKNNPNWKGDNIAYGGLHYRMKTLKKKPIKCEYCKEKPSYDLANISGEYKNNVDDFVWLCRSCHSKLHRGIEWYNWITEFKRKGGKKKW